MMNLSHNSIARIRQRDGMSPLFVGQVPTDDKTLRQKPSQRNHGSLTITLTAPDVNALDFLFEKNSIYLFNHLNRQANRLKCPLTRFNR